jgi:hypothetical protein
MLAGFCFGLPIMPAHDQRGFATLDLVSEAREPDAAAGEQLATGVFLDYDFDLHTLPSQPNKVLAGAGAGDPLHRLAQV